MTYYINGLELEDVLVSNRRTANTWDTMANAAENVPYVEKVAQSPSNFSIDLTLRGDRYDMITSIRAEIDRCNKVYFYSDTHYLYGTQKHVWLSQTSFDVDEGRGKVLDARLVGSIDTSQIHSCDFLTNWSSAATLSLGTPHAGKYSITTTDSSPSGGLITRYDLDESLNLLPYTIGVYSHKYIGLWFKVSSIDYSVIRLHLKTDATNYSYATFPALAQNVWKWCEFDLQTDFTPNIDHPADYEDINFFLIVLTYDASPPSSMVTNIDDFRLR